MIMTNARLLISKNYISYMQEIYFAIFSFANNVRAISDGLSRDYRNSKSGCGTTFMRFLKMSVLKASGCSKRPTFSFLGYQVASRVYLVGPFRPPK
jgi:hypothetical protein